MSAITPKSPESTPAVRSAAAMLSGCGPAVPCVRSEELFSQGREVLIAHAGSYYRLRMTHSNKLILTK